MAGPSRPSWWLRTTTASACRGPPRPPPWRSPAAASSPPPRPSGRARTRPVPRPPTSTSRGVRHARSIRRSLGVATRRVGGEMSSSIRPDLEHLAPRRAAADQAARSDGRGAARGPQRAAARGRRACRGAAARRRGCRVRQDPRADPADRLADLRAQGPPGLDPGDHLHQQGRRRDEGAGRGAGRQARPDHVGLAPSTRPACGSCARRSTSSATSPTSRSTTRPTPSG